MTIYEWAMILLTTITIVVQMIGTIIIPIIVPIIVWWLGRKK